MKQSDINNQVLIKVDEFNCDYLAKGHTSSQFSFIGFLLKYTDLRYEYFPIIIVSKNTKAYKWLVNEFFSLLSFTEEAMFINNIFEIQESKIQLDENSLIIKSEFIDIMSQEVDFAYYNCKLINMI
jgi:hypothetical protein